MKPVRYLLLASLLAIGLTSSAQADHHQMEIREIFLGTALGANEDAQFVELRTKSTGQQFVDGHQVKFFNAAGTLVETATFTNDADSASGNNAAILAATTEAETMFGVNADVNFDAQNIRAGGRVCFESTVFGVRDCVAWGNYSGPAGGAGAPFSPNEGVPLGATIRRSSDTNVSKNDFSFVAAEPDGGGTPDTVGVIQFSSPNYTVAENNTDVVITAIRNSFSSVQVVDFISLNGTAMNGSDYTDESPDPKLQFGNGDTSKTRDVAILEDSVFEGDETVRLRVRTPTNQAVLGPNLNATLTIIDDDPDTDAPKSRVTKPKHNSSHKAGDLMKLRGTASDVKPGTVVEVGVGLRRTMTNGNCQWLSVNWEAGPCGGKLFNKTSGPPTKWRYPLAEKLKKSVGTNVKFYTVYSSAEDAGGNDETTFKKGRNANRFEVT